MGAITVRNLPPELARLIRQRAKRDKVSLNRVVINLLEEATGLGRRPREEVHTDLDRFFGCVSKEEAEELDHAIWEQRRIEPEMWK